MSKKPLVSIITVTYNHENFVAQALDSFVHQQTDFPFEVIIADDASPDKTAEIISKYQKQFPDVVKPILRKKNVGAINNFVDAMQQAKGDFVAICDGDDYWIDNHKLQKQVDYLNKHPDKALCFNPTRVEYEDGQQDGTIWPTKVASRNHDVEALLSENFIPMNSVMYRRQDYSKLAHDVMPFDWYLHLFHARYGGIGCIYDAMSVYRRHRGGLWWGSSRDPVLHWKTYGHQTLNLLQEVQKMYAGHKDLEIFINKAVEGTMVAIARAHQQDDEAFGRKVVKEFGDYALDTIVAQHDEVERSQQTVIEQEASIQKLETEVSGLQADNFKLKGELQALLGSRVVGRIIKARTKIGEAMRGKGNLPILAVTKTKRAISKVSPEFVKPLIRTTLLGPGRKMLSLTQKDNPWDVFWNTSSHKLVENTRWQSSAPLVTVVVPYYNRADTIDQTLESLKCQTFQDFEAILVNDGSTDQASVDKLTDIKKQYPFVTIANQPNQGVAVARNNGIKTGRGKYVICLDSDDIIDPTYIEKCTVELEVYQDSGLVTTYKKDFGVSTDTYHIAHYNPLELYNNNMVITAAEFRKVAWQKTGGYKSGIGYEDWEFWLNLAEHGFWGRLIPEELFHYRVALASRFTEDKEVHWNNIKKIHQLHSGFKTKVNQLLKQRKVINQSNPETAFVNMNQASQYLQADKGKRRVLITLPWMTFGGAESLVINYCSQIKQDIDISFMTGLKSEHEWEYKFREVTSNIYHLANMFDDPAAQLEFVSNYITTRKIDTLHIVHHGVLFAMLPELKKRHPKLRVIVTMFNDVAEQFSLSTNYKQYIDMFTSDNSKVINRYKQILGNEINCRVIPNGIDCSDVFRLDLFNRDEVRQSLGLDKNELAIFFIGRMSPEKNPNVFVQVAGQIAKQGNQKAKFFMVGDGPMRDALDKQIKDLNSDNLEYLGYQSDVAKYLSAADIFVLPSSAEGFPVTMIEAMAMRVVVVASDVGAVAEVVEQAKDGFVVSPGNAEEITAAIMTLTKDQTLLNKMKTRSRQKIEDNYSIIQLGKNYTNLYKGE